MANQFKLNQALMVGGLVVKFDQFRDDRMEFLSEMFDRGGFRCEADDIFTGGDPDASFWVPEGVNGVGGGWDHSGAIALDTFCDYSLPVGVSGGSDFKGPIDTKDRSGLQRLGDRLVLPFAMGFVGDR